MAKRGWLMSEVWLRSGVWLRRIENIAQTENLILRFSRRIRCENCVKTILEWSTWNDSNIIFVKKVWNRGKWWLIIAAGFGLSDKIKIQNEF